MWYLDLNLSVKIIPMRGRGVYHRGISPKKARALASKYVESLGGPGHNCHMRVTHTNKYGARISVRPSRNEMPVGFIYVDVNPGQATADKPVERHLKKYKL
jgi:hypothetical protein